MRHGPSRMSPSSMEGGGGGAGPRAVMAWTGEGIEGPALRDKGRIEGSARDVPSLSA